MNKKKIVFLIAVLIIIGCGLFGWKEYRLTGEQQLTLYGNVDIRNVNLGFRVAGRLASLTVDEGQKIKVGQILGNLDDGPYQNALLQAQANVAAMQSVLSLLEAGYRDEEIAQARSAVSQAEANYNYAKNFYVRQQGLWKTKTISANELDNAKSARDQTKAALQSTKDQLELYLNGNRPQQIDQARANLLQAQATLAQAELNVADTLLIAPSAGVILTRTVEPGTMLAAGNTVFSVSLTDPVWIRAYVDEVNLSQVVPGANVVIYIDSRSAPYHGHIGFVSPSAEFTPKNVETPTLRTDLVYRLRIVVTDADDALRQGMPVTVKLAD